MYRILLVDDDAGMRTLMKRVLASDYEVVTASNGDEALGFLEADPESYAVILADMSMSNGNGLQLLTAARHLAPQAVRMLMSGDHRLAEESEKIASADIFRLLLKPMQIPAMMRAVHEAAAVHVELTAGVAA